MISGPEPTGGKTSPDAGVVNPPRFVLIATGLNEVEANNLRDIIRMLPGKKSAVLRKERQ